jgi:thioredoxin reductase (NADPH)
MPRLVELAIIGGGPAGLTAGLYASRARMDVVLLERLGQGGQILLTDWVDNFPGFPDGLSGYELAEQMQAHAHKFGLRTENAEVRRLTFGRPHRLDLGSEELEAQAVIIASGARPNRLGVPGEAELIGKGVSFCATCDGPFYKGLPVAVVGGGDSAVGEAVYLTRFASRVYVIHRRDELRAIKLEQERLFASPKAEVIWDTVVEAVEGHERVEAVRLKNLKTGERRRLEVEGVFVYIGMSPNVSFLPEGALEADRWGFLMTDDEMRTRQPGVYAAGDVRSKSLRQIANAVGDGAVAAHHAQKYVASLQE